MAFQESSKFSTSNKSLGIHANFIDFAMISILGAHSLLKDSLVILLVMNWFQLPKRAIQRLAFASLKVYSRDKGTKFGGSEYVSPLSEQTLWEFGRGGQ